MKSNRRSVLIGLGALTVGGGAVFGTGAFSSVEAERDVTINTEGDGAALLQFEIDDSFNGLTDGGNGVIELQFDDLNEEAETTFDGALTVANSGSDEVELSIDEISGDEDSLTFDGLPVTLDPEGDIGDGTNTEDIDIVVDLRDVDPSNINDASVTFLATTDIN